MQNQLKMINIITVNTKRIRNKWAITLKYYQIIYQNLQIYHFHKISLTSVAFICKVSSTKRETYI